jgi:hypothetical protein
MYRRIGEKMCETALVINRKGRKFVDGCGELANAIGIRVSRLPVTQAYDGEYLCRFNDCLCPVDFKRLGELLNYDVIKHGGDRGWFGEWELTEKRRT